jgi:hypothetical protein
VVTDEVHVRDEFSVAMQSNESNKVNEFITPNEVERNEISQSFDITRRTPDEVHVEDELLHGIEMISDDEDQQRSNKIEQHHEVIRNRPLLTINQRKNRKKRAKRYQFEIIRHIYHGFTIMHIKRILINMNIYYVNINVVGHTLFIGIRDERTRERVNELVHDGMLNKEHFQRLERRSRRHRLPWQMTS